MSKFKAYVGYLFVIASLIVIIGIVTFFSINYFSFQGHYEAVFIELEVSEEDGLNNSELKLQLQELKKDRIALLFKRVWFGPLVKTDEQLSLISKSNLQMQDELLEGLRTEAELTLQQLKEAQESRDLDNTERYWSSLEEATTPNELSLLIKEWQLEKDEWDSSLQELSSLGDGLIDEQPRDIKLSEDIFANLANNILLRAEHSILLDTENKLAQFYKKHPQEQLSLHSQIKEDLNRSIVEVKTFILNQEIHALLQDKVNLVSVAVYDHQTGYQFSYNEEQAYYTASTVKTKLMAAILYDASLNSRELTKQENNLISPMILESDNAATSTLWRWDDGQFKTERLINDLQLSNTKPNEVWGMTTTTVGDQVQLMKHLAYPNLFFSDEDRAYALNMLENVVSDQKWGISGGVPSEARIELKNGWVKVNERNWRINSFGRIEGLDKDYVISVMTIQNPTKEYGIQTIEEISKIIWENL